ncbi:MAG: cell division protein FtsX [Campylobacterota bacterium]|nr:cell division protein FtsX [Campylobacterota bacterium]
MKLIKNHFSLVLALVSILFSIQVFVIVDRSIHSYEQNLLEDYSIVIVSKTIISEKDISTIDPSLSSIIALSPDDVIARLDTGISKKNIELLKVTLPKFYKIKLNKYPTPTEIKEITQKLLENKSIMKVENFINNLDVTYKLLLLFKNIIAVLSITIFIVTTLLIIKELKIWQFNHSDRMNVMRLFGAPLWLRSMILFRLAITDAIIATFITFSLFKYFASSDWLLKEFEMIGIKVTVFTSFSDILSLLVISVMLSIILALLIAVGHKEEV